MKKAAGSGYSTATDLADWLVRTLGLPFREAHHVTGRAVALAEAKKLGLEKLALADLQAIHAGITADVFSVLSVQNSVKSRTSFGGTAPSEVRKQIRYWKKRLAKAVNLPGCNAPENFATSGGRIFSGTDGFDDRKQDFRDARASGGASPWSGLRPQGRLDTPYEAQCRRARTPRRPASRCRRSRRNRSRTSRSFSTRCSSVDAQPAASWRLAPVRPNPLPISTSELQRLSGILSVNHFDYRDGVLHAEDVAMPEIAAAVGTPFYCYSTATLTRHYKRLREGLRRSSTRWSATR